MNKTIYWIRKRSYTGGAEYHSYLEKILKNNFNLRVFELKGRDLQGHSLFIYYILRIIYRTSFLLKIFCINLNNDTKIRDFRYTGYLTFSPIRGKNVTLIHHIDASTITKNIARYKIEERLFYKGLKRTDALVVGAYYWKKFFEKKGYKNVVVIHNPFNLNDYHFSNKEIDEFKRKYKLTKPVIYLGNCQKAKGVVEAYDALKNLDVHLVTSGRQEVIIPALNLDLSKREYLLLLKASSIVITMSKFKEGWCRTAHEAMLLKTPVIGSGAGGMKELLEGDKQYVCEDFKDLKPIVLKLLRNKQLRYKLGVYGHDYAKQFSYKRFEKEWVELLNNT